MTFTAPEAADAVVQDIHVIDGRQVNQLQRSLGSLQSLQSCATSKLQTAAGVGLETDGQREPPRDHCVTARLTPLLPPAAALLAD